MGFLGRGRGGRMKQLCRHCLSHPASLCPQHPCVPEAANLPRGLLGERIVALLEGGVLLVGGCRVLSGAVGVISPVKREVLSKVREESGDHKTLDTSSKHGRGPPHLQEDGGRGRQLLPVSTLLGAMLLLVRGQALNSHPRLHWTVGREGREAMPWG